MVATSLTEVSTAADTIKTADTRKTKSSSDNVSLGELAARNHAAILIGQLVSFGGLVGWLSLAAVVCMYATSSSDEITARKAAEADGVAWLHCFCPVTWGTFTGLGVVGVFVAGGTSSGTQLKSLCLAVGVVMLTYYTLEMLGYAPVVITPSGGVAFPLRVGGWFFSTSFLIFALWTSSGCGTKNLVYTLLPNWGMLAMTLVGMTLDGYWLAASTMALLAFGFTMLYNKMKMFDALVHSSRGLPRSMASIRRMQCLDYVGWMAFPVINAICHMGYLSNYRAELLTVINEVVAFALFGEAMGQGVLKLRGDSKTARIQMMSADMVRQLTEAEKQKDNFFAAMSHELRTPLNGIIGLTESLLLSEDANLSARAKRSMNTVLNTARRFGKLINTILDSAAMKENKLDLVMANVSIKQVVHEVIQLVEPITNPNVKLELQLAGNLPCLKADYSRILQIMFNLVGNAAKFCQQGKIIIRAMEIGDFMHIDVEDTGIGIPNDKLEIIFKPFEQLDMSQSRNYGGTGLGLNLAKNLAKAHRGDITVRSEPGKGTVFTLALPISNVDDTYVAEEDREQVERSVLAKAPANGKLGGSGASKEAGTCANAAEKKTASKGKQDIVSEWLTARSEMSTPYLRAGCSSNEGNQQPVEILSVDDDPVNQEVVMDMLQSAGYKVTTAMSGTEALQILQQRFEEQGTAGFPRIVLMDNMMPGMTGLQATAAIRETYPMLEMPIIMVTANSDEKTIRAALSGGCNDFITKPFRLAELQARLGLQETVMKYYSREVESRKQERILNAILPPSIIERLGSGQTLIADELERVTVMFADIVGFTSMAASHNTPKIIQMLDSLFCKFDALCDDHGVMKVETIGDCYMVVAGHDNASQEDQALRILRMAKDMLAVANETDSPSGKRLSIRVGVHTGEAYAGVVGQKCPRYCLFGDTVNTASRMESTSFPGSVQVSESTYELLAGAGEEDDMYFCDLGEREVKGKGKMQTWLLQAGDWQAALKQHVSNLKATKLEEEKDEGRAKEQALSGAASCGVGTPMDIANRLDIISKQTGVLPDKLDTLVGHVLDCNLMLKSLVQKGSPERASEHDPGGASTDVDCQRHAVRPATDASQGIPRSDQMLRSDSSGVDGRGLGGLSRPDTILRRLEGPMLNIPEVHVDYHLQQMPDPTQQRQMNQHNADVMRSHRLFAQQQLHQLQEMENELAGRMQHTQQSTRRHPTLPQHTMAQLQQQVADKYINSLAMEYEPPPEQLRRVGLQHCPDGPEHMRGVKEGMARQSTPCYPQHAARATPGRHQADTAVSQGASIHQRNGFVLQNHGDLLGPGGQHRQASDRGEGGLSYASGSSFRQPLLNQEPAANGKHSSHKNGRPPEVSWPYRDGIIAGAEEAVAAQRLSCTEFDQHANAYPDPQQLKGMPGKHVAGVPPTVRFAQHAPPDQAALKDQYYYLRANGYHAPSGMDRHDQAPEFNSQENGLRSQTPCHNPESQGIVSEPRLSYRESYGSGRAEISSPKSDQSEGGQKNPPAIVAQYVGPKRPEATEHWQIPSYASGHLVPPQAQGLGGPQPHHVSSQQQLVSRGNAAAFSPHRLQKESVMGSVSQEQNAPQDHDEQPWSQAQQIPIGLCRPQPQMRLPMVQQEGLPNDCHRLVHQPQQQSAPDLHEQFDQEMCLLPRSPSLVSWMMQSDAHGQDPCGDDEF